MTESNNNILAVYRKRPRKWIYQVLIGLIIIALFIWSLPPLDKFIIGESGITIAKNIFSSLFNPNFDKLFSLDDYGVPYLLFETVMVAVMGTIAGSILSLPIAFLASKNITNVFIVRLTHVFIVLLRSIPFFVIGLIFIRVVGPGMFAGVLTVGVSSIGMLSKLFSESIEDIDNKIIEALDSTGANSFQKIRFGYFTQLSGNFLSQILYRFDLNVRNSIVLGLIGAGRLGFDLNAAIGNFRYRDAAAYLWGIIVVVLVIEVFSTFLRKRIIYGKK